MNTFVKNDDPQWIDVAPGQRRKIRAYNGEVMLVEVSFDEGAVGADHTHPHSQISYNLDGITRTMKPGDSIAVDGGKVHGLTCIHAGVVLDIFSPMREDFVKANA